MMTEKEFRLEFFEAVAEADFPFCAMMDDRGDTYCDLSNNGLARLTDIAEAAAEPLFAEIERLRRELSNIANAPYRNFEDAEEFRTWARNRARHALGQEAGTLTIKKP